MKTGKSEAKSGRAAKKGPTLTDEIIGLALAALGFIALLSLISYHSDDPSWRVETGRSTVHNWIGPVGANLSAWLYEAFGLIALLVPFVMFILAWWRIREPRLLRVSGIKILGMVMVIGSLAGLMSVVDALRPELLSFHLGGLLGHFLVQGKGWGLARLLNTPGAAIALFVVFIAGLLMATPLSLVAMAMQLTPREQEAGILATVMGRFHEWREHRAAERARRQAEEEITIGADEEAETENRKPGREEKNSRKPEMAAQTPAPAISKGEVTVAASTVAAGATPVAKAGDVAQRAATLDELLPGGAQSRAGAQHAAGRSAAAAMSGTAARTAQARQGSDDDIEDESLTTDGADAQRSVEEMVATAEVKRSEPAESADDDLFGAMPKPATKGSLSLVKNVLRTAKEYKLPPSDMLTPPAERHELADTELMDRAIQLAEKCKEFNVSGQVKNICPGPVVTTFEFKPDPGVKYSRVTSLVDDLCLGLKAESIRIDRIPGKSTVGIEVPNDRRETIRLREVIESKKFRESESKLTLALGKTIDGLNYVADLAKMPHLLIAGATGAGKSVALNSILVSLLYKATPDEVKVILVDPKRLELGLYADIPHLITPIVTDPKRASYALRWAVSEMENRYKHLAAFGVRNIDQYNNEVCATVDRNLAEDSPDLPTPLPYIVVIIDELADLMMVAARDVEESITRLAQMARAVGIHLILATQRPSVDVITGLIKANFPSRISFRVSSKVDSRTIIDSNGAEALLGQGDMLFLPPGTSRLVRVHGAFVDEKEVKRIAEHAKSQGKPDYDEKVQMSEKEAEGEDFGDMKKDEKYEEALRIVIEMGRASTSVLQRRLRIGYGRAASIIDMMYRDGIVGPEDGSKPRAVLVKADFLDRLDQIRQD
ncbi:MAG: DNA translocase FtsK [Blastocatellia bacterium]